MDRVKTDIDLLMAIADHSDGGQHDEVSKLWTYRARDIREAWEKRASKLSDLAKISIAREIIRAGQFDLISEGSLPLFQVAFPAVLADPVFDRPQPWNTTNRPVSAWIIFHGNSRLPSAQHTESEWAFSGTPWREFVVFAERLFRKKGFKSNLPAIVELAKIPSVLIRANDLLHIMSQWNQPAHVDVAQVLSVSRETAVLRCLIATGISTDRERLKHFVDLVSKGADVWAYLDRFSVTDGSRRP